MIPRAWKARLQSLIRRCGYRVERLRPTSGDPFDDQASLLAGCGVVAQVVLDAGAHRGTTVRRYRAIFPGARIHAFEPFPDSFAHLEELARSDRQVRIHEVALSDQTGGGRLHTFRHEQANSMLSPSPAARHYYDEQLFDDRGSIGVRTITLDEFCRAEGIAAVDILKMDIQGAELAALRGARGLLSEGRIALIYTEAEFTEVYRQQATFFDLCRHLDGLGYDMFNLYGLYRGRNGRLVAADVIFLRRDLVQRLGA